MWARGRGWVRACCVVVCRGGAEACVGVSMAACACVDASVRVGLDVGMGEKGGGLAGGCLVLLCREQR